MIYKISNYTNLKRVVLVSATFFLFSQVAMGSGEKQYKTDIAELERLFLGKKRVDAIKKLQLVRQNLSNRLEKRKIDKLLSRFSTIFYQNKTQQHFEAGESLLYTNSKISIESYEKGLEIEPNNVQLILGWARAKLELKECESIIGLALEKKWIEEVSVEFRKILIGTAVCSKNLEAFEGYVGRWTELKGNEWEMLLLIYKLEIGGAENQKKTTYLLAKSGLRFNHPGILYWQWKIGMKSGSGDIDFGRRYVSICMQDRARVRKKFKNTMILCDQEKIFHVKKRILELREGRGL